MPTNLALVFAALPRLSPQLAGYMEATRRRNSAMLPCPYDLHEPLNNRAAWDELEALRRAKRVVDRTARLLEALDDRHNRGMGVLDDAMPDAKTYLQEAAESLEYGIKSAEEELP